MRCIPWVSLPWPILFFLLLLPVPSAVRGAEGGRPPLSPVPLYEIALDGNVREKLDRLDLDIIERGAGFKLKVLGWPGVLERLEKEGVVYRLITPDYGGEVSDRNGVTPRPPSKTRVSPSVWNVPLVGEGSYGGYWNVDEVYSLLDSLASTDPWGIVGPVDTIGTSIEGRPILAVVVADQSQPLGTRPAVLYNALIHAREPMSMQTLLYFLQTLVEGYAGDPELTYLVQEREMWFVPVVNPDGYQYNYDTWVGTGSFGMWRKNLRNNDGNSSINQQDGVDLNRNFDLAWGYDNEGSSSMHSSPIYRGTAPFSEPETQALRDLCLAKSFVTAENFHSYGDLCLYPWTYVDEAPVDSTTLIRIADARMENTGYPYGRSVQILYPANGVALDWMYGEQTTKPKTYAFSTEVGNIEDQFYPPPERILPLAHLHLESQKILAYAARASIDTDSLRVDSPDGHLSPGEARPVRLFLRHEGVGDDLVGDLQARIVSAGPDLTVLDGEAHFPRIAPGEGTWPHPGDGFLVSAPASMVPGTAVSLGLEITDEGPYFGKRTEVLRVGSPILVFADDGESGAGNWVASGSWGIETVEGETFFSDSPGTVYGQRIDISLALDPVLDLSGAVNAVLRFRSRWEIEAEMDFGRIEVSADSGGTWSALEATRTLPGHGMEGAFQFGTQPLGVPGYAGTQRFWVDEEADLSAYAGIGDVRLRFRVTSDLGDTGEGWWIDNVEVLAYFPGATVGMPEGSFGVPSPRLVVMPNPVRKSARILYSLGAPSPVRLSVYDVTGREIRRLAAGAGGGEPAQVFWDGRDRRGLEVPSGTYFVRLQAGESTSVVKVALIR